MTRRDPDQPSGAGGIDGQEPTLDFIAVKVVVHGRVQGVFFRATTAEQASIHAVKGWVRNRADGAVEAHFEGQRASVEAMVAWCDVGSRQAKVERVELETSQLLGISSFEVRR